MNMYILFKMSGKSKVSLILLTICLILSNIDYTNCELDELECPLDCECHYFRVNWVTDCSNSNLTAIPYDWLSLNVYILNMNDNNLTSLEHFPPDIKLRSLQLADNKLNSLKTENFRGLGLLLDADFSGNNISSIEADCFRDSPGLLSLDLHGNDLAPVDGPFLISRTLMYLDLSNCCIAHISPQFFQNVTALRKLDLSRNPLQSIDSGTFNNLTSLEKLQLSHCNITYIAQDSFQFLTNLKHLELSDNTLINVEWTSVLSSLTLLESLDLTRSSISNLPEDAFAKNDWLRTLILAENELRDLDVATTLGDNLKDLTMLDLSNCRLRGPLSESAFANATKLRTLVLSGNPLSASDLAVALRPLSNLRKLSLRNCGLSRLPSNTFHRFEMLEELDIASNPLNDAFMGLLAPLDSLEHLDMSYSNLSHISRNTFSKMNHLKRLILSGNLLTYLEVGLFQNLTQLELLVLNDCGLTKIPESLVFLNNSLEYLQQLNLQSNPLIVDVNKPLFPVQMSRVLSIDLSYCNLTFLSTTAFNTTPNIKSLKLAGNKFGHDTKENGLTFLRNLYWLENLDLSYNQIKALSPEVFHFNRYISSLNLIGNPWKCTCDVADLWNWAMEIRKDTRVLVGSTNLAEDLPIGENKRKRGLMCNYESVDDFPKDRRYLRRMKDAATNRTWAKYVKEASCEVHVFVAEPTAEEQLLFNQMAIASISSYKHFYINETPPRWLVTIVAITVFYALCVILVIVYVKAANKLKKTRQELAENARKEREYYEHEARIDLIKYLQHPRACGSFN